MTNALKIIFGVLALVLFFDVLVIFKNGASLVSITGILVVLATAFYLIRDYSISTQKKQETEEMQKRLDQAKEEAEAEDTEADAEDAEDADADVEADTDADVEAEAETAGSAEDTEADAEETVAEENEEIPEDEEPVENA